MVAKDVYRALRVFTHNHDHKFENVFVHSWEADCFSVTSSNYSYEIEVKVSRSDFFNDFKKPKHSLFRGYKTGYGIVRGQMSGDRHMSIERAGHPALVNYAILWTNIDPVKISHKNCPNKFFFACPEGLIKETEVPSYAGLIYCQDAYRFRIIRKAPFLHKDELNVKTMLFDKYYWLTIKQKEKLRDLEWQVENLKEKLNARIH